MIDYFGMVWYGMVDVWLCRGVAVQIHNFDSRLQVNSESHATLALPSQKEEMITGCPA
jgi:hypothetical protein